MGPKSNATKVFSKGAQASLAFFTPAATTSAVLISVPANFKRLAPKVLVLIMLTPALR